MVANRGEADLPHYFAIAFSFSASLITIRTQRPPLHAVATGTDIPSGKPEKGDFQLGLVLQFRFWTRREAKMADFELLLKAGLLDFHTLELRAGCPVEPEVQSGGHDCPGSFQYVDGPDSKRSD